jgi:tRNA pseudouridine55 synthase
MQTPPRYSAIKLQGRPAYKLARAGEEIFLEPRAITIYELEVLGWLPPRLTLAVECSSGTYMRSLAYDLGERVGCGAFLSALVRTRSGPFALSESVTLDQVADAVTGGTDVEVAARIARFLHPLDIALQQYPALRLDDSTVERVLHGNAFRYEDQESNWQRQASPLARVYDAAGRFLAIAEWDGEQGQWQPKKVLV